MDAPGQQVLLSDGSSLDFDHLIVALSRNARVVAGTLQNHTHSGES